MSELSLAILLNLVPNFLKRKGLDRALIFIGGGRGEEGKITIFT